MCVFIFKSKQFIACKNTWPKILCAIAHVVLSLNCRKMDKRVVSGIFLVPSDI